MVLCAGITIKSFALPVMSEILAQCVQVTERLCAANQTDTAFNVLKTVVNVTIGHPNLRSGG